MPFEGINLDLFSSFLGPFYLVPLIQNGNNGKMVDIMLYERYTNGKLVHLFRCFCLQQNSQPDGL